MNFEPMYALVPGMAVSILAMLTAISFYQCQNRKPLFAGTSYFWQALIGLGTAVYGVYAGKRQNKKANQEAQKQAKIEADERAFAQKMALDAAKAKTVTKAKPANKQGAITTAQNLPMYMLAGVAALVAIVAIKKRG